MKKLISVCLAVYNNAGSLSIIYSLIVEEFEKYLPEYDIEVIFVDDGSKDGSMAELQRLKAETGDSRIHIISFSRNFGQMAAIVAGWNHAKGDCVINMAADLQDPPSQCVQMVREWQAGNEIVISYRKSHATSTSRKITSRLFYRLMFPNYPSGGFDFALIDKKPMAVINRLKERHRFYQYDLLSVGFKVKFIPYDKLERKIGTSQYNFFKRLRNFYSAFLNVSYFPLRFFAALGFTTAFSGFLYALSIIWAYFAMKTPYEGWAPIMVLILVIGGMIMLMLGILGEYVWRILDEVKGRPIYIIESIH